MRMLEIILKWFWFPTSVPIVFLFSCKKSENYKNQKSSFAIESHFCLGATSEGLYLLFLLLLSLLLLPPLSSTLQYFLFNLIFLFQYLPALMHAFCFSNQCIGQQVQTQTSRSCTKPLWNANMAYYTVYDALLQCNTSALPTCHTLITSTNGTVTALRPPLFPWQLPPRLL